MAGASGKVQAMEAAPQSEAFGDDKVLPTSNVESVDAIAGPEKGKEAERLVAEAVDEGKADVKAPGMGTRVKEEFQAVGEAIKQVVGGKKS